jgi:hypothetical protein
LEPFLTQVIVTGLGDAVSAEALVTTVGVTAIDTSVTACALLALDLKLKEVAVVVAVAPAHPAA